MEDKKNRGKKRTWKWTMTGEKNVTAKKEFREEGEERTGSYYTLEDELKDVTLGIGKNTKETGLQCLSNYSSAPHR